MGNVLFVNVLGLGFFELLVMFGFMLCFVEGLFGEMLMLLVVYLWWCGEVVVCDDVLL